MLVVGPLVRLVSWSKVAFVFFIRSARAHALLVSRSLGLHCTPRTLHFFVTGNMERRNSGPDKGSSVFVQVSVVLFCESANAFTFQT